MSRPFAEPSTRALPDIVLAPPRIRRWVAAGVRVLAEPYLRWGLGCSGIDVLHPDRLVGLVRRALAGEIRLIIAFRHPFVNEPQILAAFFLLELRRYARRAGVRLPRLPLAVFVHGYEVPRWGGPLIRWILPRMGALPIHHAKIDPAGMARVRRALVDGGYPLALAPEGQGSYLSTRVKRLESGAIRLGFEAAQAVDGTPVVVLPLSIHRRYGGPQDPQRLSGYLGRIETFLGIRADFFPRALPRRINERRPSADRPAADGDPLRVRLERIADALLVRCEALYGIAPAAGADMSRNERLARVVEAAVDSSERILGIARGPGDIIDRVHRVRLAAWDRIFVRDDPRTLDSLGRGIADRRAGEAWYAMRHMELADVAWYADLDPPAQTANRPEYPESRGTARPPADPESRGTAHPPADPRDACEYRPNSAYEAVSAARSGLADTKTHVAGALIGTTARTVREAEVESITPAGPKAAAFADLVEYVQNLWDIANRLAGGNVTGRNDVRPYRTLVAAGEPIDLSGRLDEYRSNRKAAVARALGDLENRYNISIEEVRNEG